MIDFDIFAAERLLIDALPNAMVEARDLRGDGGYFTLAVVSPAFEGHKLLDQHRMVQQILCNYDLEKVHLITREAA